MKNLCLIGNPNCGKTTLFNLLTGLTQKVGNYSGVTVDKYTGKMNCNGTIVNLIDLPGTHSLYPRSLDETIVFNTLIDRTADTYPDGVILVVNATQIRRNLVLVTQVLDLKIPAVLLVNMIDEDEDNLAEHQKTLEQELGIPIFFVSARKNIGIDNFKKNVLSSLQVCKKQISLPETLDLEVIQEIDAITNSKNAFENLLHFVLAEQSKSLKAAQRIQLSELREKKQISTVNLMARDISNRYSVVNAIMGQLNLFKQKEVESPKNNTIKIDKLLTHKYFGLPIALFILFLVFQSIFSFAGPFMDAIENFFNFLAEIVQENFQPTWFTDLLINGVIAGLGGVFVFIPQIAFLFLLLAILEGSGYMARISYIFDRMMKKFGLSGRSLVPMMSGFACAIPAIMATRTTGSRKERLISIFVIPLLSCTARLPVYLLLIGMFIPQTKVLGIFDLQGITMMGFYLFGLALALITSFVMHKLLKIEEGANYYIMELPRYRMPQWRNLFLSVINKVKVFILQAGKIIFLISILLWGLASFGPSNKMQKIDEKYAQIVEEQQNELSDEQEHLYNQERLVNSYAGHIGKFIEPTIKPLGYDWKIGIALLTSFAAREVFGSTMATIYSVGEEDVTSLQEKMLNAKDPVTGKPIYTFATVASLLVFFAVAMQCMSTLATVKSETKSWKWPILQLIYLSVLAYVLAFITYRIFS